MNFQLKPSFLVVTWPVQKSNNLLCNTKAGSLVQMTCRRSVSSNIFFHSFLQNPLQESFQFFFSYKFTKMKIKSFECPKSTWNYNRNNAWNIRFLVDKSLVLVNQRTSALYRRLLDFRTRAFCLILAWW